MSKIMQNLVVLMERSEEAYETPLKGGNMFLNRFCIDEDAAFELSGVYYLKKTSKDIRKYSREEDDFLNSGEDDLEKSGEDDFLENDDFPKSGEENDEEKTREAESKLIFQKEHFDKKVIHSALRRNSKYHAEELKTHFVYAGQYYWFEKNDYRLRLFILNEMKKYKQKSAMLTIILMWRWNLITKERMESYCDVYSNLHYNTTGIYRKDSVNDDLESLLEGIRLGKEPGYDEDVNTYFFPKLTKEELALVERKDKIYLQNFYEEDPDVEKTEMKLSESDSKYVAGYCNRVTCIIGCCKQCTLARIE